MANHPSAVKRHNQSVKRNLRNRAARSALATQIKKARVEIQEKKADARAGETKAAVSALARAGRKGLIHWKAAARKVSRLMKQANACAR
jgi:small subunit ribosomal protein S20